jgi:uncharacterized protein involved in oxidation of intracellular sulfur
MAPPRVGCAPKSVVAIDRLDSQDLRSIHVHVPMKSLIIINDAPYGNERCYNGLRVAQALIKQEDAEVTVFLMADAVGAALPAQKTPEGYYNIERMLKRVLLGNGRVLLCGSCMDARGLQPQTVLEGAAVSNMSELADCITVADRTLTF